MLSRVNIRRVPRPLHLSAASRRVSAAPWFTLPILGAVAALLAGLVGYALWRELRPPAARSNPRVSTPLTLRASSKADSIRLYWDRSLLAGKAVSGELLIVDGEETIRRVVSKQEIQSGGLAYRPVSGDVTFFLAAYGPNGFAANQVLRWIEPPRQETRRAAAEGRTVRGEDEVPVKPPAREKRETPAAVRSTAPKTSAVKAPGLNPPPELPPLTRPAAAALPGPVETARVIEEPAKPRPRRTAEVMPVPEAEPEQPSQARNWKRPLKWLHGKTSRIWPFGRKPSESDQ